MEGGYMNSNGSVVFVNPPAALDLSTDNYTSCCGIYTSCCGI